MTVFETSLCGNNFLISFHLAKIYAYKTTETLIYSQTDQCWFNRERHHLTNSKSIAL